MGGVSRRADGLPLEEGRVTDEVSVHFPVLVGADGALEPENRAAFVRAMRRSRMLGKRVFCEFTREKRVRTIPQNARLHWLIGLFCEWAGWEKNEAKYWFVDRFAGYDEQLPNGQTVRRVPSTATFTVERMVELQDFIERFLIVECGMRIPADERGVA